MINDELTTDYQSVEVFSDYTWPYCYTITGGIERLKKEYDIEVRWIAYPLNPYYPAQEGLILGFAPDTAYDPTTITQKTNKSRFAQELTKWAESNDKGDDFRNALFRALYVQGKDIRDIPMLCALCESVGLSFVEAEKVLKTKAFKDALDTDWLRSLKVDPEYVPSVLLNGELLVNPQQYELLKQLMVRHNVTRRQWMGQFINK